MSDPNIHKKIKGIHGKKLWKDSAQCMQKYMGIFTPEPPIINVSGIHALQHEADLISAAIWVFLLSLPIGLTGILYILCSLRDWEFTYLTLPSGILYSSIFFYVNLKIQLKFDFLRQFDPNIMQDVSNLRKHSTASSKSQLSQNKKSVSGRMNSTGSALGNMPKSASKSSTLIKTNDTPLTKLVNYFRKTDNTQVSTVRMTMTQKIEDRLNKKNVNDKSFIGRKNSHKITRRNTVTRVSNSLEADADNYKRKRSSAMDGGLLDIGAFQGSIANDKQVKREVSDRLKKHTAKDLAMAMM